MLVVGAAAMPGIAQAAFIPPAGVTEYRLIFVTADGIAPTSSDIATYNSFATSEAQQNSALPSTIWTAVASVYGTDAISNVACTPACTNIPIFLVDGTEVAASSTALFNAATVSLLNGIGEDQFGATGANGQSYAGGYVWTGSFSDGTGATLNDGYGNTFDEQLGNGSAEYGTIGATDGTAIDAGIFNTQGSFPIYAISGVINTPEPMTASLLGFGGIMTALAGRFRRRRKLASGA
jgi:hypothetical protein